MKEASNAILKILTERGYRITQARTEVVEALSRIHEPITIQALALEVDVDEVSVYRTIATLRKELLVEEITTAGNVTRYALAEGHHHHVVCENCAKVVHISCDTEPEIPSKVEGFSVVHTHELTFYGLCKKCA